MTYEINAKNGRKAPSISVFCIEYKWAFSLIKIELKVRLTYLDNATGNQTISSCIQSNRAGAELCNLLMLQLPRRACHLEVNQRVKRKQYKKKPTIEGNVASRTRFWDDRETEFMLTQLTDLNILKYIDGRKTRNGMQHNRSTGNDPILMR